MDTTLIMVGITAIGRITVPDIAAGAGEISSPVDQEQQATRGAETALCAHGVEQGLPEHFLRPVELLHPEHGLQVCRNLRQQIILEHILAKKFLGGKERKRRRQSVHKLQVEIRRLLPEPEMRAILRGIMRTRGR